MGRVADRKYPSKPSKSSKIVSFRVSNEIYSKLERMHEKTGYPIGDYLRRRVEYDLTRKHGTKRKK